MSCHIYHIIFICDNVIYSFFRLFVVVSLTGTHFLVCVQMYRIYLFCIHLFLWLFFVFSKVYFLSITPLMLLLPCWVKIVDNIQSGFDSGRTKGCNSQISPIRLKTEWQCKCNVTPAINTKKVMWHVHALYKIALEWWKPNQDIAVLSHPKRVLIRAARIRVCGRRGHCKIQTKGEVKMPFAVRLNVSMQGAKGRRPHIKEQKRNMYKQKEALQNMCFLFSRFFFCLFVCFNCCTTAIGHTACFLREHLHFCH